MRSSNSQSQDEESHTSTTKPARCPYFCFNIIQVTLVTDRKIQGLSLLPVRLKEAGWETVLNSNAGNISLSHGVKKKKIFGISEFSNNWDT